MAPVLTDSTLPTVNEITWCTIWCHPRVSWLSPQKLLDINKDLNCRVWTHHWVWWTAPFVGAALAAKLYVKFIMPKDQLKELRDEVQAASAWPLLTPDQGSWCQTTRTLCVSGRHQECFQWPPKYLRWSAGCFCTSIVHCLFCFFFCFSLLVSSTHSLNSWPSFHFEMPAGTWKAACHCIYLCRAISMPSGDLESFGSVGSPQRATSVPTENLSLYLYNKELMCWKAGSGYDLTNDRKFVWWPLMMYGTHIFWVMCTSNSFAVSLAEGISHRLRWYL